MSFAPHALLIAAAAAAVGALVPEGAHAQRRGGGTPLFAGPIEAGMRGGRDFENHAWSLGAQIRLPLSRAIELRPSADLFFPKEGKNGRQFNVDGALRFGEGGFYAGGGLAFVDLAESNGRERGHNLFFGLSERPNAALRSFLEFRWTFYGDTSPFRLALGFNYALGG